MEGDGGCCDGKERAICKGDGGVEDGYARREREGEGEGEGEGRGGEGRVREGLSTYL